MIFIPIWESKFYTLLLVSANCRWDSVAVLSIAFADPFGYCVSCKTGGLAWR